VTSRIRTVRVSVDAPTSWPARVECIEDPELFFRTTRAGIFDAQQICARCPMLRRCAEWALADPIASTGGVFASVPMPANTPNTKKARKDALDQLRAVAATGVPADEIGEQLLGAEFSDDEMDEVA
jgi:Transcription factor WhiB